MYFFTSLAVIFSLMVAAGCAAGEPTTSPGRAGLEGKITVGHQGDVWTANIELKNGTDGPLASGRWTRYTLTRTDVSPAVTVAASPADAMSPHFRVVVPAHESRRSTVTLWDKAGGLAAGRYHLTVVYPRDVVAAPLEADFEVGATTQAASQP